MTFEEFQNSSSSPTIQCPRCLKISTHPRGGCGCPSNTSGYGTRHIMKWHHSCPEPTKFYDATNDPEVKEYDLP